VKWEDQFSDAELVWCRNVAGTVQPMLRNHLCQHSQLKRAC